MINLKLINSIREGRKKIKKEKELTEEIIKKVVEKLRLKKHLIKRGNKMHLK